MSRAVDLWIGKHDDQAIPPRVRLRVFEAFGGKCAISGRKIMPGDKWQIDHRVPLIAGGRHEEANLQPVLDAPHKAKTREDVALKSKVARVRAKHLGIRSAKSSFYRNPELVRGVDGVVRPRR